MDPNYTLIDKRIVSRNLQLMFVPLSREFFFGFLKFGFS